MSDPKSGNSWADKVRGEPAPISEPAPIETWADVASVPLPISVVPRVQSQDEIDCEAAKQIYQDAVKKFREWDQRSVLNVSWDADVNRETALKVAKLATNADEKIFKSLGIQQKKPPRGEELNLLSIRSFEGAETEVYQVNYHVRVL